MGPIASSTGLDETPVITVRLWAAAKAAAGVATIAVPAAGGPLMLSDVVEQVLAGRPERLSPVLAGCSVLVGDLPVTTADPRGVVIEPGATVEFLPPFAGG